MRNSEIPLLPCHLVKIFFFHLGAEVSNSLQLSTEVEMTSYVHDEMQAGEETELFVISKTETVNIARKITGEAISVIT